jgi:hypothetical protein
MHRTTRPSLSLLLLSLLVLAGCPTLKLGRVATKAGSVSPAGFTLTAEIIVSETDETEGADQQRQSGKGLLGVHVPAGWTVTAARLRAPDETVDRALFAAPQGAAAYAESFPTTGGVWWAFASPTRDVPMGDWTYNVEIDVAVPKKTKTGEIGISASILSDDLSELSAPRQFGVTLKGKALELAPRRPLAGVEDGPEAAPSDNSKAPAGG